MKPQINDFLIAVNGKIAEKKFYEFQSLKMPINKVGKDVKFTCKVGDTIMIVSNKCILKVGTKAVIRDIWKDNGYNKYMLSNGQVIRENEFQVI